MLKFETTVFVDITKTPEWEDLPAKEANKIAWRNIQKFCKDAGMRRGHETPYHDVMAFLQELKDNQK